jgi:hypothetical protein
MLTSDAFDINSPVSIFDFFKRLFFPDFMPHGHCYFFRPDILWLNVASDAVIALSYYMIPISLLYIVIKRRDMPFQGIFLLFGAFIVACGTTHFFSIYTVWTGLYRVEGLIKLATAIISFITALVLIPLLPKIVALPGLKLAVEQLTQKKEELEKSNTDLSIIYKASTDREEKIILLKKEVNELSQGSGKLPPYKV